MAIKYKDSEPHEKFHVKFIKEQLGVHCKTLNVACRSELSRLPINTNIIMASIKYLDHLITFEMSLVHDIFLETLNHNPWVKYMGKMFSIIRVPIFELIILQHMYLSQTII